MSKFDGAHGFVFGTIRCERALGEVDLGDANRTEIRMLLAEHGLNVLFPARVVHPRDGSVGGEIVLSGVEAECNHPFFDRFVEPTQLVAGALDTDPDHADVVVARKRPVAAHVRVERRYIGGSDGVRERCLDGIESLSVHIPEEFEGDVDLCRIDEAHAIEGVERSLCGSEFVD